MNNLLVLNFYPAFLPPKSAGESHLYNFYFEVSKVFNVTLLTSGALNSELEVVWHTNSFVEKRIPKDASRFYEEWQNLSMHSGGGDLSGPCVAVCAKHLSDFLRHYLECYPSCDAIIHEFPFTVDYDIFMGLDGKPRIYNSNNCEFALYSGLHANAPTMEIPNLVRKLEKKLLRFADLVMSCGRDDLVLFENLLGESLKNGACISRAFMGFF